MGTMQQHRDSLELKRIPFIAGASSLCALVLSTGIARAQVEPGSAEASFEVPETSGATTISEKPASATAPPSESSPAPAKEPTSPPAEGPEPAPAAEPAPVAEAATEPSTSIQTPPPKAASEKTAMNSVYFELGGPAIIYSLNYERRIQDFNLRVGIGGLAWGGIGYAMIPFGFNYVGVGSDVHHLELGAAATLWLGFAGDESVSGMAFSPIVGYRLQEVGGGFHFRAGISPLVAGFGEGGGAAGFIPLPYVSFGGCF